MLESFASENKDLLEKNAALTKEKELIAEVVNEKDKSFSILESQIAFLNDSNTSLSSKIQLLMQESSERATLIGKLTEVNVSSASLVEHLKNELAMCKSNYQEILNENGAKDEIMEKLRIEKLIFLDKEELSDLACCQLREELSRAILKENEYSLLKDEHVIAVTNMENENARLKVEMSRLGGEIEGTKNGCTRSIKKLASRLLFRTEY
jgi:hypothetical protein